MRREGQWGARTRRLGALTVATMVGGPLAGSALAAGRPGTIDPSFGDRGQVTTTVERSASIAGGASGGLVLPDGKVLMVGGADLGSTSDFLLARYDTDGSLDASFGSGGVVNTAIAGRANARRAVLEPDGRILVLGEATVGENELLALARYNPDGSLDASFGTNGIVTEGVTPFGDFHGLAVDSEGKILVGDEATSGGVATLTVRRFDADGSADPSFGAGGAATATFAAPGPGSLGGLTEVLAQPDGKVVAAGVAENGFAVARFGGSGALDSSFGAGGLVIKSFGQPPDLEVGAALQSDGKIVVAGGVFGLGGTQVFRLDPDGGLDSSFGSGGTATAPGVSGHGLVVQPDGKVVLAGNGGSEQLALVRLNADGTLDPDFGSGGVATAAIGFSSISVGALVIDPLGRLVAIGVEGSAGSGVLAQGSVLARFSGEGSLDPTFGDGGEVVQSDFGSAAVPVRAAPRSVLVQRDRKVVVFARVASDRYAALVRYRPNGSLDPTFGRGGEVTPRLLGTGAALTQPDGKLIVVGTKTIERYRRDGTLDPRFGRGGIAHIGVFASKAALERHGRILVAGDGYVARCRSDGSLDRSFGHRGFVHLKPARAFDPTTGMAVDRHGRIVVAGRRKLIRLRRGGAVDRSFGKSGLHATRPRLRLIDGVHQLAGNRLLVFGRTGGRVTLLRYRPDGTLDPSFGKRGVAVPTTTEAGGPVSVARERQGKLIVATTFGDRFGLLRLNSNGSRDRSFGHRGLTISRVRGAVGAAAVTANQILLAGTPDGTRLRLAAFRG
jgi:uncharacterized delta-60 repeat protein